MEESEQIDVDGVIEQERESRRTLIAVRQLVQEFGQTDPATFSPEEWREKTVRALRVAGSSLEWGLATSRALKAVAAIGRDFD